LRTVLAHIPNADTDTPSGIAPVIQAVYAGKTNFVQLLLSHGADVNRKSATGQTALSVAVEQQRSDLVELLLANGADANQKAPFYDEESQKSVRMRPLAYALKKQQTQLAQLLKKFGARP